MMMLSFLNGRREMGLPGAEYNVCAGPLPPYCIMRFVGFLAHAEWEWRREKFSNKKTTRFYLFSLVGLKNWNEWLTDASPFLPTTNWWLTHPKY
jgi:hypothetical protein